jgi:hypothetical protein
MTGAAAVAALLAGSGVREVFGYVGTSELALASALRRRLPAYRNARGDREAVFMAAGASAFHPGRAAALLHGARGLTNAAGALGDAWRNEVGFLCLVGLPGTGHASSRSDGFDCWTTTRPRWQRCRQVLHRSSQPDIVVSRQYGPGLAAACAGDHSSARLDRAAALSTRLPVGTGIYTLP